MTSPRSRSLTNKQRSFRTTRECWWAFASSVLLCLAFPPLGWWPLAFVAPIGWLSCVQMPGPLPRGAYKMIYLAGLAHWLILIQWVRLPHWSAYFGWLVLSAYLAVYLPVFVGVCRLMYHRWRWPMVLAAPIVWTGLELARGHLFTGFSLCLLGHTVVEVKPLIQIADTFGAYGVSFVLVSTAAAVSEVFLHLAARSNSDRSAAARSNSRVIRASALAICFLALTLIYGLRSIKQQTIVKNERADGSVCVALIQGVFDTEFDKTPELAQQRAQQAFADYLRLSRQAVQQDPEVDLIVWPESMFSAGTPLVSFEGEVGARPEFDMSAEEWKNWIQRAKLENDYKFEYVASDVKRKMLVGMSRLHASGDTDRRYNSAVFANERGEVVAIYDKMHPVMFGEYVPFGDFFPWLYRLTPMGAGLTAGEHPISFNIDAVRFCPSICFENTVPHLIRRQVKELAKAGHEPDALVTITNDGWFWGSSLLDVHLACGVFRSVEMRKPMLIAANTGISAWIDASGTLKRRGPRRQEDILIARVGKSTEKISRYRRLGDWPAIGCLILTAVAAVSGLRHWRYDTWYGLNGYRDFCNRAR